MIRWEVHKLGFDEWLVSAVMPMNVGVRTVVRTVRDNSDNSEVKVRMHQGLQFVIVM